MKKLLNLIKNNADKPRNFSVKNMDDGAHIYLYDVIDPYWGVSAKSFIDQLNTIDSESITLHINSPGGDVFDARAIATAIRSHKATFTARVEGLAASAATYIALSADQVHMADGAFFMIHKGWTFMMGNADEARETASLLDKVDDSIANDYAKKTGLDKEKILDWMSAETWFNAEESKEHGFIDQIIETESVSNQFDLSAFDNAPQRNEEEPSIKNHRAALERRVALYERGI